jgi:outer membrane scaffolding protein for murein synthesis (MipA/OmpV family)
LFNLPRFRPLSLPLALLAPVAFASPTLASAQDNHLTDQPSIYDGDHIVVGAGPAYVPSYEGSDNQIITGSPLIRGSVSGLDFQLMGTSFSVDLIPDAEDATVRMLLGPQVRVNLDRTRRITDPVVARLGKKDIAVEAGGFAGLAFGGLTNPYDELTARVEFIHDVSGEHGGSLLTPSLSFSTPLSPALFTFVSIEATHASGDYMDSFFSVSPTGALASGLPVYAARSGWKNWAISSGVNYDLSGDLRDGGFGLFAGASYSRLLNSAAASPIVSARGDRDQWYATAGVTYAF